MTEQDRDQLEYEAVRLGLARTIVLELAPEEGPIFDRLARLPAVPAPSVTTSDDPLGSGVEHLVASLSPQVMTLVSVALSFLLASASQLAGEVLKKVALDIATDTLKGRVRLYLAGDVAAEPSALDPARLADLERRLRAEAVRIALAPKETEQIVTVLRRVLTNPA